jgi:small subunit ribosomal protein S17e
LGKAVPKSIKSRVEELLEFYPDKFGTDFDKNKELLNELGLSLSRFDRNMIAGFLSRKVKALKSA